MAISLEPSVLASAELAQQARGGSTAALGELYHRLGPALFRLAYRLTGSREDAEDVVHDLFVALPEALQRYEERGRFDAWMRRLTARLALMRVRNKRRRAVVTLDDEHPSGEVVATHGSDLEEAVRSLPEPLRSVLVLKEVEGYSHAEIGEMLGISVVTSRVRLMRALRRLRRILGGKR